MVIGIIHLVLTQNFLKNEHFSTPDEFVNFHARTVLIFFKANIELKTPKRRP